MAAVFGSLAGLGGGFLIVPVLRLFFGTEPAMATADSLFFVFSNTLAASISFIQRRVVDLPRGIVISVAAIPSSVAGAYVVRLFSNRNFDDVYGLFLITVAVMVIVRRNAEPQPRNVSPRAKLVLEIATGLFVGFISSMFGIGGGILLVPIMLVFFRQAVHTVAATSAFVVMLTSPSGILAHVLYGDFEPWVAAPLVIGGFTGGSLGARIARHMKPIHLSNVMAGMLLLAAVALGLKHVHLPAG